MLVQEVCNRTLETVMTVSLYMDNVGGCRDRYVIGGIEAVDCVVMIGVSQQKDVCTWLYTVYG
jgi:hypothetical protein